METKQCQNCKRQFTIEPEDFVFYKKVGVPPPTWCPKCRTVRRMLWRNERTLYKRKCDLCGRNILAMYHPSQPFKVYCSECFFSDKWDQLEYGQDYDWDKPFFTQLHELQLKAPRRALDKSSNENCEYSNHIIRSKNCYLVFAAMDNEECFYANELIKSKNVMDALRVSQSEMSYECIDCVGCYNLTFSEQCKNCLNSSFLYNCRNCSDCFLCTNLNSKSHCFKNEQYSKEEFEHLVQSYDLGDRKAVKKLNDEFKALKEKAIRRYLEGYNNTNSTGDDLKNTKNCRYCFNVADSEDCAYITYGTKMRNSADLYAAYPVTELCYECVSVGNANRCLLSHKPWESSELLYCDTTFYGSQNCFGCVSLRNKQYCILNKQYSKEQYEELVPKILKHMDDVPYIDKHRREYRYGEFFPPELSPFAYNETITQTYFSLTREEVVGKGYTWRDPESKDYKITLKSQDLPDHIKDVDDSIMKETIGCEHGGTCNGQCTTAFKIVLQELQFYKKMNLSLPRLCANCRHYQRLKYRNPLRLWHRKCMCAGTKSENEVHTNTTEHFHGKGHCPNEFETSYTPESKKTVYCEKCYQAEVI